MTSRQQLISIIADRILERKRESILKVGIDGLDGAGKTFFADELASELENRNIAVIRSSTDFFHNPKEVRYRLGRSSPEGFFLDSYNYEMMCRLLLDPLKKGGTGIYIERFFNVETNQREHIKPKSAAQKAILICDGIFLHREELKKYWDYSIFLNVSRKESLKRCFARDQSGSPDPNAASNTRYVWGQKIYLERCNPSHCANLVVNNENLKMPFIEKE